MKKSFILFILTLISILFLFFHIDSQENQLPHDDEQAGLNEQIVIKFSHVVAENTPKGLAAQRFATLVQDKTNNRVKVEVFPNGMLYSDEEAIEALRQGTIQMIAPASSKLSPYFPQVELLDLPFAFTSYESFHNALNGELGDQLLTIIGKEHFIGLSFWSNGFKQITSNTGPIITPQDLGGQYFRVMSGKVINKQFQMLNVTPKAIPFNLTYRNLQNGIIDGQENTLSNIYSKKFYEVQNYMTISNHGFLSYVVMMNKDFWNKLPSDIQASINEAITEATLWNQKYAIKFNEEALIRIKNNTNIKIHKLTESEKKVWMKHLAQVYDHFESTIGEDLINKVKAIK